MNGVVEPLSEAWYAVYTKFKHEKSVASLLERKDLHVFLPVYRTMHRWSDRNKLVILPLFPCYVFVRTGLDRKLDVLRTAGVRWFVEIGGHACFVPEAEIEAVRKICATGDRVQPHPFLKDGNPVRIRTGALAGIEGLLVRIKNQSRVVISVQLLQKSVSVEAELANLEALSVSRGVIADYPFVAARRA
jgi:transcription antitermination factor NusG